MPLVKYILLICFRSTIQNCIGIDQNNIIANFFKIFIFNLEIISPCLLQNTLLSYSHIFPSGVSTSTKHCWESAFEIVFVINGVKTANWQG